MLIVGRRGRGFVLRFARHFESRILIQLEPVEIISGIRKIRGIDQLTNVFTILHTVTATLSLAQPDPYKALGSP
jgi:hypothetical protein